MATLTVTNLNDSGAGSLRQALADAEAMAGADNIVFDPSLSGGTIRLASALQIFNQEIVIEGDIDGDGVADITISGDTNNDGTGDTSLLNNGGDTTINGVIFDKGRDDGTSAYIIDNDSVGTLTLTNSYITDAVLNGTAGFIGTIRNAGDLTVSNVLIDNATTNLSGPSAGAAGIANFAGSTLSVDRLGVTGSATSADSSYVVLGINNYGSTTGGILAIGDGDTGEDGTGLVNRSAGTGTLTIGVSGTRGADALDVSGAPTDQTVLGFGGNDTIIGSDNNDTLYGGFGADMLFGGTGKDTIEGAKGGDTIDGGAGKDNIIGQGGTDDIHGKGGADAISSGKGADIIRGGGGADVIDANDGIDTVFGGGGNDIINGGKARDEIRGQAGDDTINGNSERDTLLGGGGNDIINGGTGDDTLKGQTGDDILNGQQGNDILTGNAGNDTFVYNGQGDDTITDMLSGNPLRDQIDVSSLNFANFAAVMATAAQVGGNVVFSMGAGTLKVDNHVISDFVANDFVL